MPSTNIDGSVIVILSEAESRRVYDYLVRHWPLDALDQKLADKIARDLKLPPIPPWTPAELKPCKSP